jgi:hypothetical protein
VARANALGPHFFSEMFPAYFLTLGAHRVNAARARKCVFDA